MTTSFRIGAFALVFVLFASCSSDQPKQISDPSVTSQNPDPIDPIKQGSNGEVSTLNEKGEEVVYILDNIYGRTPTEIREPRVKANNSEDDLIEKNGKEPIVFNGLKPFETTVGGIQFKTSFEEARKALSTPIVGACGSSGDYYQENLCLKWSDEEPRKLRQAYVLDGYLGTFDFAEPIGKVTMKSELKEHFSDADPEGKELLRLSYNKFFDQEASYNCNETRACQAVFYNNYINWIMPNLTVIFSKDRKVLIGVIMNQDIKAGDFSNPIDLVRGQVRVEATGETLALGETWNEIKAKISNELEPESILEASSYRKDYTGTVIRVDRAGIYGQQDFEVDAKEPSGDEAFSNLVVYADNTSPIMMNGKYVKVSVRNLSPLERKTKNWFTRALSPNSPENGESQESLLTLSLVREKPSPQETLSIRMPFFAKKVALQKELVQKLGELLKKEFKSLSGEVRISQRFGGLNAKQAPNRNLTSRTSYYNLSDQKGLFVYMSIGVNTGNMVFSIDYDNNPVSKDVMSSVDKEVDVTSESLASFKLGTPVKLVEIDRSRNEAFLLMGDKKIRVEVNLYNSIQVSSELGITRHQNIISVSGLPGAALGLAPVKGLNQETTELESQVIYVSSAINPRAIKGLCGIDKSFKVGMSQDKFSKKLKREIKSRYEKNNDFVCENFVQADVSGDNEARTYFFPKQGLKVNFTEKVLTGVERYLLPGQQTLVEEGAN